MQDNFPSQRQATFRLLAILSGLVSLALLLAGCGKPPVMVYKHLLEYPSPALPSQPQVPAGLKVELFSVAQAFNSPAMVYRPTSYRSETYSYHRWRGNPGQLVTDFLLRDLRQSRVFKGIFGYTRTVNARFLLDGAVEEFQEVDAGDHWSAVLALNITLLDTTREEIPQRVIFQKNYRADEPLTDKTPQGLTAAMSRALEKLSGAIIADVHRAALKRLSSQEKN